MQIKIVRKRRSKRKVYWPHWSTRLCQKFWDRKKQNFEISRPIWFRWASGWVLHILHCRSRYNITLSYDDDLLCSSKSKNWRKTALWSRSTHILWWRHHLLKFKRITIYWLDPKLNHPTLRSGVRNIFPGMQARHNHLQSAYFERHSCWNLSFWESLQWIVL